MEDLISCDHFNKGYQMAQAFKCRQQTTDEQKKFSSSLIAAMIRGAQQNFGSGGGGGLQQCICGEGYKSGDNNRTKWYFFS